MFVVLTQAHAQHMPGKALFSLLADRDSSVIYGQYFNMNIGGSSSTLSHGLSPQSDVDVVGWSMLTTTPTFQLCTFLQSQGAVRGYSITKLGRSDSLDVVALALPRAGCGPDA